MAKVALLRVEIRLSTIGLRGTIIRAISTLSANEHSCSENDRFWHLADVQTALMNVRFEGNNGDADVTRCRLMRTAEARQTT